MADKRSAAVRAAGGVVWRVHDGVMQVALVHRPRYDDWSLPKGKINDGETELSAAVREVGEELGSTVAVSRRLTRTRYRVGSVGKSVAYWSMHHLDGDFVVNDEVDEAVWLDPQGARKRVSYDADRRVLDDFTDVPVAESVIVLVRHAKAGKRSEWHGADTLRPLESAGRAQAGRLHTFLRPFAPDRVISAEPVRCVQTVQPLADGLDLTLTVDPQFGDEQYSRAPEEAETALLALAKPRRVAVVCSQGSTIPGLVEALAPRVRSADTRKGAAWVLSFADEVVVSADYYDDAARE